MFTLLALHVDKVLIFALVLCRVGGLLFTAPIFAVREVPIQFRALLCVLLAAVLAPLYWGTPMPMPDSTLACALLAGGEVLIGAALGMGVTILLSAALMAGRLISQASGISLADVLTPGFDEEVPVHAHLFYIVTLTVFVALGGHRMVIGSLLQTFASLPPGSAVAPATLSQTAMALISESFQLGIRAAAPALTAVLLSTIVLALVGRTLPQLNVLALGFGVNLFATLLVLTISIGAGAYLLSDHIGGALDMVVRCVTDGR